MLCALTVFHQVETKVGELFANSDDLRTLQKLNGKRVMGVGLVPTTQKGVMGYPQQLSPFVPTIRR